MSEGDTGHEVVRPACLHPPPPVLTWQGLDPRSRGPQWGEPLKGHCPFHLGLPQDKPSPPSLPKSRELPTWLPRPLLREGPWEPKPSENIRLLHQ